MITPLVLTIRTNEDAGRVMRDPSPWVITSAGRPRIRHSEIADAKTHYRKALGSGGRRQEAGSCSCDPDGELILDFRLFFLAFIVPERGA